MSARVRLRRLALVGCGLVLVTYLFGDRLLMSLLAERDTAPQLAGRALPSPMLVPAEGGQWLSIDGKTTFRIAEAPKLQRLAPIDSRGIRIVPADPAIDPGILVQADWRIDPGIFAGIQGYTKAQRTMAPGGAPLSSVETYYIPSNAAQPPAEPNGP